MLAPDGYIKIIKMHQISKLSKFMPGLFRNADAPQSVRPWAAIDPNGGSWAELLSISPIIIHTFPLPEMPLGAASIIGPMLRDRPAHFLIMACWSLEEGDQSTQLARIGAEYLVDHPKHRLTFLVNNKRERELMLAEGQAAMTINQNCLLNDEIFRPLPDLEPLYDAVYNARLTRWKRQELARHIDKLALIYFRHPGEQTIDQFRDEAGRLMAMMPNARFINPSTTDGSEWIPGNHVNRILAQSRVGLCLSEVEGAMRASMEYLMAGLCVVSTPSLGGRDFYFDDKFWIICKPDPRSVREAVDALIAKNVPRELVRARTMAKVDQQRRIYIDFVQALIDRAGGTFRFENHFWQLTRGEGIMRWGSMMEFSVRVSKLVSEKPQEFSSVWSAEYAATEPDTDQ